MTVQGSVKLYPNDNNNNNEHSHNQLPTVFMAPLNILMDIFYNNTVWSKVDLGVFKAAVSSF